MINFIIDEFKYGSVLARLTIISLMVLIVILPLHVYKLITTPNTNMSNCTFTLLYQNDNKTVNQMVVTNIKCSSNMSNEDLYNRGVSRINNEIKQGRHGRVKGLTATTYNVTLSINY